MPITDMKVYVRMELAICWTVLKVAEILGKVYAEGSDELLV